MRELEIARRLFNEVEELAPAIEREQDPKVRKMLEDALAEARSGLRSLYAYFNTTSE